MAKGMIGISGDLSQWVIIIVLVIVGICIFSMFMGQREKFAGQVVKNVGVRFVKLLHQHH